MEKIYSNVEKNKLLHIIHKVSDFNKRNNLCDESSFLQVATIELQKDQTFKPHKHIFKDINYKTTIAQESWIIIQGKVKVILYDIDDTILKDVVLTSGDCSITFEGGHNYISLESNTLVYEYKTGPYEGVEKDKRFIYE
jgi:cupin fold WbuC family metalloprotein